MKTIWRNVLFLLALLAVTASFGVRAPEALAEGERSYYYDSIKYIITVLPDSTFDVEEAQMYVFTGEYHQGERVIPFDKISTITDVSVIDAGTGKPLQKVSNELDKTNPESWGKFTEFNRNSAKHIVWYYDARDTSKTWIVQYKVHGGISFLKDHDEIYWDLFDGYDVPIKRVEVNVRIPENTFDPKQLTQSLYVFSGGVERTTTGVHGNTEFYFTADGIKPNEPVTIAAGWPKGLISKGAFWKDFFAIYFHIILSVLIILASIIFGLGRWYFAEKYRKGRGTIIAEYEPPQNLRPAQVDVIVREGLGMKAWAATVVDLAVRGYVRIEEDAPETIFAKIFGSTGRLLQKLVPKQYLVTKVREYKDDAAVLEYEKQFLDLLFTESTTFSTKEMKNAWPSKQRAFAKAIEEVKKELYKELDSYKGIYEVGLSKQKYLGFVFVAIFVGFWIAGAFGSGLVSLGKISLPFIVLAVCALIVYAFAKFDARLSEEGAILKDHILGFKLFLNTAERFRMQNLTPDIFEKYLPYAIIFGIEKKWAKAFEGMNMKEPAWYGGTGAHAAYAVSGGGTPSFSAPSFSSSFSSSFASAFSSAGGGGASGGGGSAGGGGGGGGGGAS